MLDEEIVTLHERLNILHLPSLSPLSTPTESESEPETEPAACTHVHASFFELVAARYCTYTQTVASKNEFPATSNVIAKHVKS